MKFIRNVKQLLSLGIALILVLLAAITGAPAAHAQNQKTLTIFAAASLTDAFNEMKTAFQAANPGVNVVYSFGASSTLATQLTQGAPADIFASANNTQMNVAVNGKRIAGKPRTFAKNRLILIVPTSNPGQITSLKDLSKPNVKIVLAAAGVPVRDYTNTLLDKLAQAPGYGVDYKAAVLKNVVSEESDVRQVVAKVSLGEADAGFVYRSDVTPDVSGKITALPIPDALNTIATYPIAITNDTPNTDLANAFIAYVLSDAGQATLVKWNFISIVIPALPPTITLPTDGALHVGGQVLNPLKLTADDLKNNFTAQTQNVTYLSGTTPVPATFTGVYLRDILDAAQLNFNPDVKNDVLSLYIVATGSDGYQAIVAYGDIAPDFGNLPIMVAYAENGQPISTADQGPIRLVVPGDQHGGRYVGGLVSLEVRRAPGVSQ